MKKLLVASFVMTAFALPLLAIKPPDPPHPGPTKDPKSPKPPVDCKILPRPCLPPLPGK